jgi:hypothetical protein
MGIVGARRAALIHSQRGRNIYLFVFTLLSVVQLLGQLLLSVNVYVVNQCFANEDLTGRFVDPKNHYSSFFFFFFFFINSLLTASQVLFRFRAKYLSIHSGESWCGQWISLVHAAR